MQPILLPFRYSLYHTPTQKFPNLIAFHSHRFLRTNTTRRKKPSPRTKSSEPTPNIRPSRKKDRHFEKFKKTPNSHKLNSSTHERGWETEMRDLWRSCDMASREIDQLIRHAQTRPLFRNHRVCRVRIENLKTLFPTANFGKIIRLMPSVLSSKTNQNLSEIQRILDHNFVTTDIDQLVTKEPFVLNKDIEFVERNAHVLRELLELEKNDFSLMIENEPVLLCCDARRGISVKYDLIKQFISSRKKTQWTLIRNPSVLTADWSKFGRLEFIRRSVALSEKRFSVPSIFALEAERMFGKFSDYGAHVFTRLTHDADCDPDKLGGVSVEDLESALGELIKLEHAPRSLEIEETPEFEADCEEAELDLGDEKTHDHHDSDNKRPLSQDIGFD